MEELLDGKLETSDNVSNKEDSGRKEIKRDFYDINNYRIRCGAYYPLYRQDYNGYVFYKFPAGQVYQKNGEKKAVYKQVSFYDKEKKAFITTLEDGWIIKPLALYESCYFGKNDLHNPIWTLIVTDWEVKKSAKEDRIDAINEYKQTLEVKNLDFNDEDLPF